MFKPTNGKSDSSSGMFKEQETCISKFSTQDPIHCHSVIIRYNVKLETVCSIENV